ncbi:MAG: hypothetical protein K9M99_09120 [Candidatus Cloacimonetes bacterium]|nr:hypothetical protein [Candidatus Cloacimonadota bacterium]
MIIRKLNFKTLTLWTLLLLLTACSSSNKFKDAHEYSKSGNFVPAIMLYDKYIQRNHHSAEQTIAELERSECYYQLGLQAYTKKNWVLADRLFFLANSDQADELADNVHLELAHKAEIAGDIDEQLEHYDYVINFIPDSELVPEMLRSRIDIYLQRNQKVAAYADYKTLWESYPESEQAPSATEVINPLIPWFLESPRLMRENGNFSAAIAEFQLYANYPSSYREDIYYEIGTSYYQWGMYDLENKDYVAMRQHFDLAVANNPDLLSSTEHVKSEVRQRFIDTGDQLLNEGEIALAIETYSKSFLVLPDDPQALKKIDQAKEQRRRFAQADSLYTQAELFENRNEYKKAKDLYYDSWKLSGKTAAERKSHEMDNYIRAESNPKNFALEIIRDYKNGIIKRNVDTKLAAMTKEFGDQVSSSDWKAVYSYGEFNFEVRIDIFSPAESHYYAWRINLIERTISPLNKDSEALMK